MALSVSSESSIVNGSFYGVINPAAWRPGSSFEYETLCILLVSTLLVVCYFRAQQGTSSGRLPPGPTPWPVFGNLLALADGMPHVALMKLASKYGGIMHLRLGKAGAEIQSPSPSIF